MPAAPRVTLSPAPKNAPNNVTPPTEEQIRLRAFQIWQARGNKPGNPAADWEQAKKELVAGIVQTR